MYAFGGNYMLIGLILGSHLIIGLYLYVDLFIRVSRDVCAKM